MIELVRLRMRPSRDKKSFRYMLDYKDQSGKRRQISLGHANKRRAERQRYEYTQTRSAAVFVGLPGSTRKKVLRSNGNCSFACVWEPVCVVVNS